LNRRRQNGKQVSVAGWENSHDPSYGGSGTGRGAAEDIVVVVASPEPGELSAGQRYREGAGRGIDRDRRMITNLGSDAVDRECHRDGLTETRKCDGRICGWGQKAEAISGHSTRQTRRRQAGS